MTSASKLDRRAFLVRASLAAGGLAIQYSAPANSSLRHGSQAQPELTCWMVIATDDAVTIRVAHAEMGQGSSTGLAMLVAEELDCDWTKVRIEFVSPQENLRRGRVWGRMTTGASRSIPSSQDHLRRAGAIARTMLVSAAAARWNVPASQCTAHNSIIRHARTGQTVSYGAVAEAAAKAAPPGEVSLKDPRDWALLGTPQRRRDVYQKITGQPVYAIDVQVPNMLHAGIVHCPVFGGSLRTLDTTSAAAMPGVRQIVRLPAAVAVIADTWWRAKRAVEALRIEWDDRGNGCLSTEKICAHIRSGLDAPAATLGRSNGDVARGLASAAQRIVAEYAVPFLAHATMEPQTCTAHVRSDGVEIWVPTQDAMTALVTAADAAGVANDRVTVHTTLLGGGFGRRGAIQDYVREAVLIAKEVDQPVKLLWTREEDIGHDFYRPIGMARLEAGLDVRGMPLAWHIRLAGPSFVASLGPIHLVDRTFVSGLAEEMPYDVPNYLVDFVVRQSAVPPGLWRGINYVQNAYYRECFIDEMAHAAGLDPVFYRRSLLRNSPRNLAVLDAAAKRANWSLPPRRGVFRGVALNAAGGSYCAQVVELSVVDGDLRVHRVISAIDCGHAVNPLSIKMQTEGAVAYALTAALYGEITIENGRVEQSNFHDYRILRMNEMPEVETVLVPSGGFWGGVGEMPVPPLAPALCNAIFAATGQRIRSLPVQNHQLRNHGRPRSVPPANAAMASSTNANR
ncbi:MAG TPA: molybdopterin cofactor-binding domain-containing protein [Xanthobacteraceae bacterium]